MVNPNQMADELKRNGGFIPGVKPGRKTSEFIDSVISRITFPGSIFLRNYCNPSCICYECWYSTRFAYFFGGTSLLDYGWCYIRHFTTD